MEFHFIDNAAIDVSVRKKIRSQVMIGRNAGKKRNKITSQKTVPILTTRCDPSNLGLVHDLDLVLTPRCIGSSFSSNTYPCELNTRMRFLIHQFMYLAGDILYPRKLCISEGSAHTMLWFRWFQSDEAFFHCVLTLAEGQNSALHGLTEVSPQTLKYLSNTYRCINNNLQKGGPPSDATVAAVMSIAMHNNLLGETELSKIHLDALVRMVELRGGIARFDVHLTLVHKICRTDIEYALQKGTRPRFTRDEYPRDTILVSGKVPDVFIGSPVIQDVWDDLRSVSCLLNSSYANPKIGSFTFQEVIISTSYRLLHHFSLVEPMPKTMDTACYLVLLAFITTMFLRGPELQHSYNLLAENLRSSLKHLTKHHDRHDSTMLWLFLVAGISVFNESDARWLILQIRKCLSTLQLRGWDDVQKILTRFPWVGYFHDKRGQQLWTKVHASQE